LGCGDPTAEAAGAINWLMAKVVAGIDDEGPLPQ
jgi:hypothetical protein